MLYLQGVDYMSPLWYNQFRIVTKRPGILPPDYKMFIEVFDWPSWIMICLSFVLAVTFISLFQMLTNIELLNFELINGFVMQPMKKKYFETNIGIQ